MKLCYQVATPDVAASPALTCYQGPLEKSLSDLATLGYDGAEFMTIEPARLNVREIGELLRELGLSVPLVCTGEVFPQLGVSFTDPDSGKRAQAVEKVLELTEFAAQLDANINIGRVRGCYAPERVAPEQTEEWLVEALARVSDYAADRGVLVAIETVSILQTNLLNTLQEAGEIAERTGRKNLGWMLDTFHLNLEERSLLDAVRGYGGSCFHVHLCDSNRRYPGNCSLDFEKILEAFHESGYDGSFTVEVMQLPDMYEAAKRSVEHLSPLFERIYGRPRRDVHAL